MNKRITAAEVIEAYEKTGLHPIAGSYFMPRPSPGHSCACGLGVLALAELPPRALAEADEVPPDFRIRDAMNVKYGESYRAGFEAGFDSGKASGENAPSDAWDGARYIQGRHDGAVVRLAVADWNMGNSGASIERL